MTAIGRVIAEAASRVAPPPTLEDRMSSLAARLLERTSRAASRYPQARGALLGGSFAKGTWLPDEVDIDIFVRFTPETPEEDFERMGLAVGAEATRGHPRGKKYAQHPYTEATVDGVRVNIVPCFAVQQGMWKSAADRSPFHVELVRGLPDGKKTEVRLLKKFMRAAGVYGAEIQNQGFSGYVAEVLVIRHGAFEGVLKWFSRFVPGRDGRIFTLPDPVDEKRDLGVAVSPEKLGIMVMAARDFLRRPREGYFDKLSGTSHPGLGKSVYAILFSHRKLSEDILWGELRRTTKHLVRHLEARGFVVARSMAASNNSDRSAILLIPEFDELPALEQRVGPTVDRAKDVDAFLASNRSASKLVWVDADAKVRVLKPRDYVNIASLLADVSRGRSGPVGASKELERGMKRSSQVLHGTRLNREAGRSRWLGAGITEITTDALGTGPD